MSLPAVQADVTLPRLLDRRQIAAELGVKLATAETIMRACPLITIGRRVFVDATDVHAYVQRKKASSA